MSRTAKQAVVTGASSGIGEAYARRLAAKGFDLMLIARRRDALDRLAADLEGSGANARVLAADLSKADGIDRAAAWIESADELDMLVNNAGMGGKSPMADMAIDDMDRMIAVNVSAVVRLTRAALPGMVSRGEGTIVNVSSGLALAPRPGAALYAAGKAFVAHFTAAVHGEVSDKGVRLQALMASLTRTNLGGAEVAGVFDRLPRESYCLPDEIVDASMRALASGELYCMPALEDAQAWAAANDAVHKVGAHAARGPLAQRYRHAR